MARGATQTQTQATQGRRAREPSADESESDRDFDAAAQTQGGNGGLKEDEIASKAADLVRLMLFMEYKRRPVQRPMITQQVLGGNNRGFNAVFEQAQKQLRSTFGMEIVPVRPRQAGGRAAETQTQAPANGESSTQAAARGKKTASTKSYMLRNVLPASIITMMSTERPLRHLDLAEDEWQEDRDAPDSGALLRWEKSDGTESGHVAMLGIRTIILSLVLCSGRVIQDDHLHALLRRLNLHRDTVLPYSSLDAIDGEITLDKYLELLNKQNYLEKTKIVGHNGPDGEGSSVEWRWGSREVEFSEKAAGAFIEMIFMDTKEADSESDEEDQDRRRRRRGPPRDRVAEKKAKREKLRVDIAKAAGGELEGKL